MLTTMQAAPLSNIAEFTVSELSSAIKRTVEDAFGLVRLRGEISGYRGPHSSGHAYLCLKDDSARIDAVIWRTAFAKLKFKPEEGLEVIVTGRITTFPGKSSYQIVIEQLEPAGAGALMALLEERKKKFAAEGLFDPERKRRASVLAAGGRHRDFAHGRGDSRHAARLHRALPHPRAALACARAGRDLRRGGCGRHSRLQCVFELRDRYQDRIC